MKNFEDKRRGNLKDNKMRMYPDDVVNLERLYADKSYALVRHPDGGGFVPLIPRHMTSENWRNLFWMEVDKLVIRGVSYMSLCSACRNKFECMSKGLNRDYNFECKAEPGSLIFRTSSRQKGEITDEDVGSLTVE